jgi:hypothetical protein
MRVWLASVIVVLSAVSGLEAQSQIRSTLVIGVQVVRPPAPRTEVTQQTAPAPVVAQTPVPVTTAPAGAAGTAPFGSDAAESSSTAAAPAANPLARFRVVTINF